MWIKRIKKGVWRIADSGFFTDANCPDGEFNHIEGNAKEGVIFVNGARHPMNKLLSKEEK